MSIIFRLIILQIPPFAKGLKLLPKAERRETILTPETYGRRIERSPASRHQSLEELDRDVSAFGRTLDFGA